VASGDERLAVDGRSMGGDWWRQVRRCGGDSQGARRRVFWVWSLLFFLYLLTIKGQKGKRKHDGVATKITSSDTKFDVRCSESNSYKGE